MADPAVRLDMGPDEVPLGVSEPAIAIATDQTKPTSFFCFLQILGHQPFLLADMADTKPLTLKEKVKRFRLVADLKQESKVAILLFQFQVV